MHTPTNTSMQIFDISICLQESESPPPLYFLAGVETDCTEEAAYVLNELSRAETVAELLHRHRDNEQETIMKQRSSQVMTVNRA